MLFAMIIWTRLSVMLCAAIAIVVFVLCTIYNNPVLVPRLEW